MRNLCFLFLAALLSQTLPAKESPAATTGAEVLNVTTYESFSAHFSAEAKAAKLSVSPVRFKSIYAPNGETPAYKRTATDPSGLSLHIFQDLNATNTSTLPGPGTRQTAYETLVSVPKQKAEAIQFSHLAFFDSSTLVCLASGKFGNALLLVDISSEQMSVSGYLPVPPMHYDPTRNLLIVDRENQRILLGVNSGTAISAKSGELGWKSSKQAQPGVWVIRPVHNDEKRWTIDREKIVVRYFSNSALDEYAADGLRLETIQNDAAGNLWIGFSDGLIGVLPILKQDPKNSSAQYQPEVVLYNFNKDASLAAGIRGQFAAQIQQRLHHAYDPEVSDTSAIFSQMRRKPDNFSAAYLEDARNTIWYNLVQDANRQLDSDQVVTDESAYWAYVQLGLDNPLAKPKQKLHDYLGYQVRPSQYMLNSFSAGADNAVFATSNLAIYKLSYDAKKSAITVHWTQPYTNSFLKDRRTAHAGSGTTPAYNASHQEVVVCDNDFPYVNLLILDAGSGKLKYRFPLFDRATGSFCRGGLVVAGNTIIAANTFGHSPAGFDAKSDRPASGLMKFSSTTRGSWHVDYDWNAAMRETNAGTATPTYSTAQQQVFIYQPSEAEAWQLYAIGTAMPKGVLPPNTIFAPDLSGIDGLNPDNRFGNLAIGPQQTIYIGTAGGLLRIQGR